MLALECETGMLLSYYKGGLITENNVFVFSSAVLVTQCYVRANLQLLSPAHMKGIRYLRRTALCTGTPGWRWSAAKIWKRGEAGAESHLFRVCVGVTGDKVHEYPPQCLICCKTPSQSIKITPLRRLILDSFQLSFRFRPLNKGHMNPLLALTFRGSRDPINETSPEAVRT